MYRVVVVDDEEPVLESYKFIFEKYIKEFVIVGQARNGKDAVREIISLSPDLVFMDVQMPGVNGIDVIKELRPILNDTVFILSTAYERFDIASKAIKLGVYSYLTKPVSKAKIVEEVEKVKRHLDSIRQSKNHILDDVELRNSYLLGVKRRVLTELSLRSPTEEEWCSISELSGFNCSDAMIIVIDLSPVKDRESRKLLYSKIVKKIEYKYLNMSSLLGDKIIVLIPANEVGVRITSTLKRELKESLCSRNDFGIGGIYPYYDLQISYREAISTFHRETKDLLQVVKEICFDNYINAIPVLEDFIHDLFCSNDRALASSKLSSLFDLLLYRYDRGVLDQFDLTFDSSEEIFSFINIEGVINWGVSVIGRIKSLEESKSESTGLPPQLLRAIEYIHHNYDKPLQLSQVAEYCQVSSGYLSRLFTESLHKKFVDYLNIYKIDRAIKLLEEDNLTIKEAAFRVGYYDPNYFSRIFKKYKGISPSAFEGRMKSE